MEDDLKARVYDRAVKYFNDQSFKDYVSNSDNDIFLQNELFNIHFASRKIGAYEYNRKLHLVVTTDQLKTLSVLYITRFNKEQKLSFLRTLLQPHCLTETLSTRRHDKDTLKRNYIAAFSRLLDTEFNDES
jgi:hypothetical protein